MDNNILNDSQYLEEMNEMKEMYDKKEEGDIELLKEYTQPKTKGVDVTKQEEVVRESKSYSSADDNDGASYVANAYVSEFTKKAY